MVHEDSDKTQVIPTYINDDPTLYDADFGVQNMRPNTGSVGARLHEFRETPTMSKVSTMMSKVSITRLIIFTVVAASLAISLFMAGNQSQGTDYHRMDDDPGYTLTPSTGGNP